MKANGKLASALAGGLLLVGNVQAGEVEAAEASIIPRDKIMREFDLVKHVTDHAHAVLGDELSEDVQIAINGVDMYLKGLSDEVVAKIDENVLPVLEGSGKCMTLKSLGKEVVKACYMGGSAQKKADVEALKESIEARKANISELAQEREKVQQDTQETTERVKKLKTNQAAQLKRMLLSSI